MKRISMLALLVFSVASLYVVACNKDVETQAALPQATETEATNQGEAAERGPLILATVTTGCHCGDRVCSVIGAPTGKRNAINIALNSVTHSYYNVSGPGLTYRIYQGGSCSGTPIATFNCSLANVVYASNLLSNNTSYSVKISAPGASSGCYQITTGTCLGTSCTSGE